MITGHFRLPDETAAVVDAAAGEIFLLAGLMSLDEPSYAEPELTGQMPRFAIVVVVSANEPDEAWGKVSERLLHRRPEGAQQTVAYVGAPWFVSDHSPDEPEYETDAIRLRLDGEPADLAPAE